ncbi:MAG: hypothetical protein EP329_15795 [Deltaproteobacteria bacterium]|nr:MAG: hypothetical protein EP329_15795 [Deltaproteobacteria bacterium]
MQRLTGVVVSDATLLASFVGLHADLMDVSDLGRRGTWGLGFHGNGEMLIKRAPLGGMARPAEVLATVRARHVVLSADGDPGPRRTLVEAQPLRYRDWLFAASGTSTLGDDFVARVQETTTSTSFAAKRGATPEEALMMVFIDALYRGHARDTRKLPVATLREAIAEGSARLRELAGAERLSLAVLLHAHEQLFAVPLGRPLFVNSFSGASHGRTERTAEARRLAHLRAVAVSDHMVGNDRWTNLETPAHVGIDCEVSSFPI